MKNLRNFVPMAFMALAMVGALSSFAIKDSKDVANVQGFVKLNPQGTMCDVSITCSNIPDALCTVGATQIWAKDALGRCLVETYRVH